ncbi:uncharacterized protein LOC123942180 [Meles meles]|uniref:uncharacterized protein LOC123942180 n=1 Tax=Meles meles TaxID=9662 RepID=UPI001E69991C|nr:uncharacterized protein LOC123942180 [Meles meles]
MWMSPMRRCTGTISRSGAYGDFGSGRRDEVKQEAELTEPAVAWPGATARKLQEGRKEDRWEIQDRGRKTSREFPGDGEKRCLEAAAPIPCKLLPGSLASLLRSVPLQEHSGEEVLDGEVHSPPAAPSPPRGSKEKNREPASGQPKPAGSGRCRSRGAHAPRLPRFSAGRAPHRLRNRRPVRFSAAHWWFSGRILACRSSAARSFCRAFRSGSAAVLGSAASCRTGGTGKPPQRMGSGGCRDPRRRRFNRPPVNNLPLTSDASAWIYKMLLRDLFDPVTEVWEAGNSPMIFLLKAFSPKPKRITFYDGKFHILGHVGSQTFLGKGLSSVLSAHMPANNKVRAQGEGATKHIRLYLSVKLSIHDPQQRQMAL